MKLCRPLLLAAALLAPLALRASEAPDSEFTRVAALVQAKKTDEAVREIDALIRRYPNDARLSKIRAQLGGGASVATALAAPAMPAEDRFEINTVRKLMEKAQAATEADSRRLLLEQVLERTERLVRKYPKDISTWTMRAMAAIVLDRPAEGRPAAQTLKSLGALESNDAALGDLMAELNIKGWLNDDELLDEERSARIRKWAGTWSGMSSGRSYSITLEIGIGPELVPIVRYESKKNTNAGVAEMVFRVPGLCKTLEYSDSGEVSRSSESSCQITDVRFNTNQTALLISYHIEGREQGYYGGTPPNVSANRAMSFYYDPSFREAVIPCSKEDFRLPTEDLRRTMGSRIGTPEVVVLRRQ